MNILKKRSFKHSSVSVVFTAVVILLVLLANAVLSLLASMYSLYFDLTSSELWTLSDAAKEVISQAEGEITITFCHDRDYIEANTYAQYISNTAKEIEKEFPNVHLRYINSKLEPHLLKDYKTTADTKIRETDIIVEKGDASKRAIGEKPNEFRKYSLEAFFIRDNTVGIWAYNGEEVFASAFLAVTADMTPKAYFTEGHNESLGESDISAFASIIQLAGYEVGRINLMTEEIPEDCRLLIINDPKSDFKGRSIYDPTAKSEIKEIEKFLERNNSLMVFLSPDVDISEWENLPYFLDSWGIVFGDGTVTDKGNSIDIDGKALVAEYTPFDEDGDHTIAASLHKELSGADAPPMTIVKSARPIMVSETYTAGINEEGKPTYTYENNAGNTKYREMSTALISTRNATLEKNGEVVDRKGGYNLLTITQELNQKDNHSYKAYVMAAGTKFFTSADYLESNAYGNRDLMYYAFRVMGRENVPADIDFKVFAKTDIENMTAADAIRTTVLLVTLIPLAVAVCGVVIVTRRKYR